MGVLPQTNANRPNASTYSGNILMAMVSLYLPCMVWHLERRIPTKSTLAILVFPSKVHGMKHSPCALLGANAMEAAIKQKRVTIWKVFMVDSGSVVGDLEAATYADCAMKGACVCFC